MANCETKMDYASVLTQPQNILETQRATQDASETRFALYCSWMLILGFLLGAFLGQVFGSAHAQGLSTLELRSIAPPISGALELRKSLVSRPGDLSRERVSTLQDSAPPRLIAFQLPLRLTLHQAPHRQIPMIGALPAWQKNGAEFANTSETPLIAIVIDDLGPVKRATERALRLPAAVTLSFLPSARSVDDFARRARAGGHEILIHMPMEPKGDANPGPHALKVNQSGDDITRELSWAFSRLSGYVGINNHMGSRFSHDLANMSVVMKHIKAAGLLYLDSRTSGSSVAPLLARTLDVPFAERDVFVDDPLDTSTILARLKETEAIARRTGFAIAIAHPRDHSLDTLEVWLATIEQRGLAVAPLTAVIKKQRDTRMRVVAINER